MKKSTTKQPSLRIVSKWLFIKGNDENLRAMPNDRDVELLFDNGEIYKMSDDHPFAEIIAWREIFA